MMRLIRTLLMLVLLLGVAYAVMRFVIARPAADHPWFAWAHQQRQPLVFAHQGGEAIRPSNTLLAFEHAVALGAEVLDADLHATKDGVLVLIHDQTVDRTTNGAGEIRALTMRQLGELDAAYSFSPDGGQTFPYRGQGVTIPTLESVFQKYPNAYYGIEIKQTTVEAARTFCGMIRAYSLQSQVLVSAFAQDTMDAFRAACPEVATSATLNESAVFVVASMLRIEHVLSPAYYSLQVPETYRDIPVLTPRLIEAARNRNLAVQPWTINSEADLKRIMALGVGGINTDYPDRLLALRNNVAK